MLVKPQGSSGFLVPLFAQPMQADWAAGVLRLGLDGPIAVNGARLEYRFRQRATVVNALAEPASVVTGLPGTGKSEVVAAMFVNQLLRARPTLFASKNHQALAAVLPRLNSAVDGGDLIIQTSSRHLARRQNYLAKLQSLLARPSRLDAAQGETFERRFSEVFARQRTTLNDFAPLEQACEDYGKRNQQHEELRKQLPLAAQSDDGIASWSCAVTPERLETLEAELRAALSPPASVFGRLWHMLRRGKWRRGVGGHASRCWQCRIHFQTARYRMRRCRPRLGTTSLRCGRRGPGQCT